MKSIAKIFLLISASAVPAFGGLPQKWEDVPKPVRETILANGGKEGSVDRERETINGKAVYEAAGNDKDGTVKDFVITEDGKLVETKTDDAADLAKEQIARAKKLLDGVKFTHAKQINNPYLPLANLKRDILEGTEDGKKVRVERTAKPDQQKTFKINDQDVEALVVEDRVFIEGQLEEVALDYFAQDDKGTVYYLGEEVNEYKNGKVDGHEGSWMLGRETQVPGVLMPAMPKVGDKFYSEDVSATIHENDEVESLTETVTVPAGVYQDCLKMKETLADGKVETKYYAKGIGAVREIPSDGDEQLKSHEER